MGVLDTRVRPVRPAASAHAGAKYSKVEHY